MFISELYFEGVRNLTAAKISLGQTFNVFYGANGSGKTSIFESLYALCLGKSFRATKFNSVINTTLSNCSVSLKLNKEDKIKHLGCTRDKDGNSCFKIMHDTYKSAIKLAKELPLQLMDYQSFALLSGVPEERRKFIDWGVFHVEPSFSDTISRFKRALKQRNAFIKSRQPGRNPWDASFLQYGEEVDRLRRQYLAQLLPLLQQEAASQLDIEEISFRYLPGWEQSGQIGLEQALLTNKSMDSKAGFTTVGPHRADLEVFIHGEKANTLLSRGQTKNFVFAMLLARAKLLPDTKKPIFLIDDLRSELDKYASRRIISALEEFGAQVFINGIDKVQLEECLPKTLNSTWFHVEHGSVISA